MNWAEAMDVDTTARRRMILWLVSSSLYDPVSVSPFNVFFLGNDRCDLDLSVPLLPFHSRLSYDYRSPLIHLQRTQG